MALDSAPDQQQDLWKLLRVLGRHKWLLVLLIVGLPTAVYVVSASARKMYAASAIIQVQGAAIDTSLFAQGAGTPQTGEIAAAARLAKTQAVAQAAAARLNPRPARLKSLIDAIEATSEIETGFVTIKARSLSPPRAAEIANAYAAALVAARSEQARAQINKTIIGVQRQISALPDDDTTGRRTLSAELQRLRALQAAQNNNAVLVQPALIPDSAVSPKPIRNAAFALILAALLGVGLAFLIERLDRRVQRSEELRDVTGLPVLALLPAASLQPRRQSRLYESDAIQSLRASLSYFDIDQPMRSMIVSSPGAGEGKTTVAANLAMSLARSGRDVILIDADLRRSELSERLALDPHAPSLTSLLASGSSLSAALTAVEIDGGRLRVMPAGSPPPPNPSELMQSDRMREVLKTAESICDIVIVDSTPLLPVSDIVPVLREVSGMILLVRMKRTTREAIKRALEIVELAGGTALGLVAIGVEHEMEYGYSYDRGRKRSFIPNLRKPAPIFLPGDRRKPSGRGRRTTSESVPSAAAGGMAPSAADPVHESDWESASVRSRSPRAPDSD